MVRYIYRAFLSLGLLIIAIAVYTGFNIANYGKKFDDTPSDAAIILGAAIWDDKPSPVFQSRIDHGINLYQNNTVDFLIFTGGIASGKTFSESEVARNYAIKQGVPHNRIFIETHSKITFENLSEAKILIDENQFEIVLLVSDPLHMKRAMTMAYDLNIKAKTSPTPFSLYKSKRKKLKFLVREIYFYLGYLIVG